MGTVLNAHQRARALVIADIVTEARRQLATQGASALSLRAVARELGMASSAMYRYVPSRDELLTILITQAYDALGEVTEAAAATGGDAVHRWRGVCRAIRGWALDHPQEYALLYGSPVPGYHAPDATTGPASRVTLVLTALLADAHRTGHLRVPRDEPLPAALAADVEQLARTTAPQVPPPIVARALVAWALLFGQISFELFGRFTGVVHDTDALFDHAVTVTADLLGITPD
jgi:AcrR family transcriptional regulator